MGYTRQNIGADGDPQDGDYGTDVLKIPGTNGVGPNYEGIPGFQIASIANIGNTNTGSPFQFRDNQYTTNINVTKIKGAHNIRAGFEYDNFALNHFQPQGGTFGTARGTFGFDGSLTALKGGTAINTCPGRQRLPSSPANSWAQFLLGYPSETGKVTQVNNPIALRFSTWAAVCARFLAGDAETDYRLRPALGILSRSTRTTITAPFVSIPPPIYLRGRRRRRAVGCRCGRPVRRISRRV